MMNAELLQLATLHGPKVRDIRSLCGFRLLPKKKNAEFKNVIGKQPDDDQARLILWNFLDPESKRIATSNKAWEMKYDAFCEWIGMRYKCAHGNLEHKA